MTLSSSNESKREWRFFNGHRCVVALLAVLALLQTGCSKEKAEAIKTAAEAFRNESVAAIERAFSLVRLNTSMIAETQEEKTAKIISDFEANRNRDVSEMGKFVDAILIDAGPPPTASSAIDQAMKETRQAYDLFADMFQSLPRGSFFAKDAVAKAERHAIRLTLQMGKLASNLQKIPVQNTAARARLVDAMLKAEAIRDEGTRKAEIARLAQQLLGLAGQESLARSEAIRQCIKAAEAGRTVAKLIHDYGTLKVSDILDLTKDLFGVLSSITGGSIPELQSVQKKFEGFVTNQVDKDPLWKDVLDQEVHWNISH